jgi:hypothetical protein
MFYAPGDPENAFLSDEHTATGVWVMWGLGALLAAMSVFAFIRIATTKPK